jgi:IS30 family transposase
MKTVERAAARRLRREEGRSVKEIAGLLGVSRSSVSADHLRRQREIEQFWLDVAGLPQSSLRKSQVNAYSRSSQRKRLNTLPYGTCKLIVHSTEIAQEIYGSIQELAGFNRSEWLY